MPDSLDIEWSDSGVSEDKRSMPVESTAAVTKSVDVDGNASGDDGNASGDDARSYVTSVIYDYHC